ARLGLGLIPPTFDPNFSTVRPDDASGNRQAQAHAAAAKSGLTAAMIVGVADNVKLLEYLRLLGWGNAQAAVTNSDNHAGGGQGGGPGGGSLQLSQKGRPRLAAFDQNLAAVRRKFDSV